MEELKALAEKILTPEQFEEIEESEYVTKVENCGMSGKEIGCNYFNVIFTDGDEMDIYVQY